ncbi:MAG: hypothetical protein RL189_719 [Pseudomonadota bacterium]|jgi:hypothetical protein
MKKLARSLTQGIVVYALAHSAHAAAFVNLSEWKKPKVFGLAPSADTAQVGTMMQSGKNDSADPLLKKTNVSLLGLYPLKHEFVGGFTAGGNGAEIKNIPTPLGNQTLKTSGSYAELAGLYAFSDNLSLFVAPGFSTKTAKSEKGETKENFITLTSYSVYAVSDELGLGLGLSGKRNERTQSIIPLLGGAWQPTAEFRLDGWLPANVHARWKYSSSQALFARIELNGDSALSEHLAASEKTDLQMLGAQLLMGWSIGMPIGFGTGFVRVDPSLGVFKGQLTQTNTQTEKQVKTSTAVNPVVDLRVAVAF